MTNICSTCGSYHADRSVDPAGPWAICPECGVPIRLGVHTPDTRLASWITAVVTLSMTTGFFVGRPDPIFPLLLGVGLKFDSVFFLYLPDIFIIGQKWINF